MPWRVTAGIAHPTEHSGIAAVKLVGVLMYLAAAVPRWPPGRGCLRCEVTALCAHGAARPSLL